MYAAAFDLVVVDTELHHLKGVSQAYAGIGSILQSHGFIQVQGSVDVTENEDMANLFLALQALKEHGWFPRSVRDIQVFSIDQWSDFTTMVKTGLK